MFYFNKVLLAVALFLFSCLAFADGESLITFDENKISQDLTKSFYLELLKRSGDQISPADLEKIMNTSASRARRHFFEILKNHEHQIIKENDKMVYKIKSAPSFFSDLLTTDNTFLRALSYSYLNSLHQETADPVTKVFTSLFSSDAPSVKLFKYSQFTDAEWEKINKLFFKNDILSKRYGDIMIAGSGPAFYLTNDIFLDVEALNDPTLLKDFARTMRHLAHTGVKIDKGESDGATGFHRPGRNRIAYVIPAGIDAEVLVHEGHHSRFTRFKETQNRWIKSKKYAIPYEVDGPKGGFLTLLNEINSWRHGSAFSKAMSDAEIIEHLVEVYKDQAGEDATKNFSSAWSEKELEQKSVASAIRKKIVAFNKQSDEEIIKSIEEAIKNKNEIGQINFLRLMEHRFGEKKEIPQKFKAFLEVLKNEGKTLDIVNSAAQILNPEQKTTNTSEVKNNEQFLKEQKEWLDGFIDHQKLTVPSIVAKHPSVFYFAIKNKISDSKIIFDKLETDYGIRLTSKDKDLVKNELQKVEATQGFTLSDKLKSHVVVWNYRNFQDVWQEFLESPTWEVERLLITRYKADIKSDQVAELIKVMLDKNTETKSRAHQFNLLQRIFYFWGNYKGDLNIEQREKWLLDEKIQKAVTQAIFNNNDRDAKEDFINFINTQIKPEEMPLLKNKILELISDTATSKKQLLPLSLFLRTPKESGDVYTWAKAPFLKRAGWGDLISAAFTLDKNHKHNPVRSLEFIRIEMPKFLLKEDNVQEFPIALSYDKKRREDVLKIKTSLNDNQKQDLNFITSAISNFLDSKDPEMRKQAIYTASSNPLYLLELEKSVIKNLSSKNPELQKSAAQILSMLDKDFWPEVENYFKDPSLELSPREKLLLDSRKERRNITSNHESFSLRCLHKVYDLLGY